MGTFLRKNSPIELAVKKRPKIPAAAPQLTSVGRLKHRTVRIIKRILYSRGKPGRLSNPGYVS